MATRVELNKDLLGPILDAAMQSCKRAINSAKNPALKPIFEKELAELQNARNTLTDVK